MKLASLREERSCCGATLIEFDKSEGILIFYTLEIEGALDFDDKPFPKESHGRTSA